MWVQSSQEEASPISCDTCNRMIDEEDYPRHWPACRAQRQSNQQQQQHRQEERLPVTEVERAVSSVSSRDEGDDQTFICQICRQTFPIAVVAEHAQICRVSQIQVECQFCSSIVPSGQLDGHQGICPSNPNRFRPEMLETLTRILNSTQQIANNRNPNRPNSTDDLLHNSLFPALKKLNNGIKKRDLGRFPTEEYTKEAFPDQEKCSICQEDFKQGDIVMKIVCSHIHHEICYKDWLLRENICPLCKVVINPSKKQPQPEPQPKRQSNPIQ